MEMAKRLFRDVDLETNVQKTVYLNKQTVLVLR